MIFQTEQIRNILILTSETHDAEKNVGHTRCSNSYTFMRGMKAKSFHELKPELLNRVKVVIDVSDSKYIVENILALGKPVAVDMEGVTDGITSMVQVCDAERNISLSL